MAQCNNRAHDVKEPRARCCRRAFDTQQHQTRRVHPRNLGCCSAAAPEPPPRAQCSAARVTECLLLVCWLCNRAASAFPAKCATWSGLQHNLKHAPLASLKCPPQPQRCSFLHKIHNHASTTQDMKLHHCNRAQTVLARVSDRVSHTRVTPQPTLMYWAVYQ